MHDERPIGAIVRRQTRESCEYMVKVICRRWVGWSVQFNAEWRIRDDCVEIHVLEVVCGECIARKYRRIGYASRLFRFCAVNLDAILANVVAEYAQKPTIAARGIVDFRHVLWQLCPHFHCECLGRVKRAT